MKMQKRGVKRPVSKIIPIEFKSNLNTLRKNPFHIHKIKNPSKEECEIALSYFGHPICYDRCAHDEDYYLYIMNFNGELIQFVPNPTEKIYKAAINQKASSIYYIKNPSEELCNLAVSLDESTIMYIPNPSEEVCLIAVRKNPDIIAYIKKPSLKVICAAVEINFHSIQHLHHAKLTREVCFAIIDINWRTIIHIPNPPMDLCIAAIKKCKETFQT